MHELCHILSCDVGQTQDPSALVALERREYQAGAFYTIRNAHRWPLGTPYAAKGGRQSIVGDVLHATRAPGLVSPMLVLDQTGVGRPVVDMLRYDVQCEFVPVTITAGSVITQAEDGWRVPKKDLIGAVQAVLGTRRLEIVEGVPFADLLRKEMENFRAKQSAQTGHVALEAWRAGDSDDLVLALACGLWAGENLCAGGWDNSVAREKGRTLVADTPRGVFSSDDEEGRPGGYIPFGGRP